MKKIFLCISMLIISSVLCAQTPGDINLVNGDFEAGWFQGQSAADNPITSYPDWASVNNGDTILRTLNVLYGLSKDMFGPGPLTSKRTTDMYDGNYAMLLSTDTMRINDSTLIIIPGAMGTVEIQFKEMNARTFVECFDFPQTLKGFYKYSPVKGDSASIEVKLKLNDGTIIASGQLLLKNAVTEYTPFEVKFDYKSDDMPDSLRILFVASAGYDFNDLQACKGQIGSTLYLDNLVLDYALGLSENLMSDLKVNVFPNPTTDYIHFELADYINGRIAIYDINGREVLTQNIDSKNVSINLNTLESGNYIYRIIEGKMIQKSGKINKL